MPTTSADFRIQRFPSASMSHSSLSALLLISVLVAAGYDLRCRRIPNWLTLGALICALTIRVFLGTGELLHGVAGGGIATAVMLPLFVMGGMGGGDTKLMIAVGAFLGPKGFVITLAAVAIIGGALSIVVAVRRGMILPVILDASQLTKYTLTGGWMRRKLPTTTTGLPTVPYGVAIALGTACALYLGA